MQHLEYCTGVWVGKTLPFLCSGQKWFATSGVMHWSWVGKTLLKLMGRVDVVLNIWCQALEFVWVRHSPCYWARDKWFATSRVMHWSWVGKTLLLLMIRREVVCNIWSHALEFGWVRLPPLLIVRRKVVFIL